MEHLTRVHDRATVSAIVRTLTQGFGREVEVETDSEDTNSPDPDPEQEPAPPTPDVIDLAAIERQQRLRDARAAASASGPPPQRGPSEHATPDHTPSEPEPTNPTTPLWSAEGAAKPHRHDGGGPPLPPAPGAHTAHPAGDLPTATSAAAAPATYLEGEPTTRLLCASMHLQASFATHVRETLLNDSMQAVAPVWGLDPVALVRHARVSTRIWAARDAALRVVVPAFALAYLLLLISIMFGFLPWQGELLLAIAAPAVAWLYAWNVIFQHYRGARARALGVMDQRLPARDWAEFDANGPVLSGAEQARLEDLARANVITSGGSWPFVGDGQRVSSWTLTVDLEKGTKTPDGGRLVPAAVSPLGIHRHLLAAVPQLAPTAVHAQHRLYVRGPAASTVPGLLPSPPGPSPQPGARVAPRTVDAFALKPTPAARSYVALQRILWGGQIVPSLLVRAERQRNTLFIEASEHVLPPLRGTFHDVTLLPRDSSRVRRDLIFASFHATRAQSLRAWGRWFENRRALKAEAEATERSLADFSHGMPVNHGKASSLREDVSDVGRLNYFGVAEETLAVVALRRRVFEALESYLDGRDVDVTDLRRQMDVIALSVPVSLVDKHGSSATLGSNAG